MNSNATYQNNTKTECDSMEPTYFEWEPIYYLAVMCPIAFFGLFSNVITFRIFLEKSFNSVTFKYLKLITITDFFICLTVIPYCLTSYTSSYNYYDQYMRNFYLAYIYLPMANLLITLSMYLNLLVTIERLISVGKSKNQTEQSEHFFFFFLRKKFKLIKTLIGWPMKKYILFKPSRYYLSCAIVLALAVLVNLCLFFLYDAKYCRSSIIPTQFLVKWTFFIDIYQIFKEIITRVLPLIILIISNVILIFIVKKSRNKMRKKRERKSDETEAKCCSCLCSGHVNETGNTKKPQPSTVKRKVNQDNQLTLMTIFVAILYTASTIPMVFVFPGVIFKGEQLASPIYKTYAAWSNILELIQCSFRSIIYVCFTTQFRQGKLAI